MGYEKYKDIIDLPHHVSATRPHRSMVERGAQFSPFAALTGYDAAIAETGRLTDSMTELSEDAKAMIDEQLRLVVEHIKSQPTVDITYFRPDERKSGGHNVSATVRVKKIDPIQHVLTTTEGLGIPVESILSLTVLDI